MNVGSLFSGIGGIDLGLERAGHRVVFQCEKDEYRRRVLARHWPGVPCYEDVRAVARFDADGNGGLGRKPRRRGPRLSDGVDLLCGGFPCQDLSVAGRRAGLAGERSGLFFEFARIADALLPDGGWVLIENVPGLFSSNGGRDFAVLLATLAELGFHDCAWRVLDSRYLGVPQRRRRVFILARRSRGRSASEVLLEPESGGGDFEASTKARKGVASSVGNGIAKALHKSGNSSPSKGADHDNYIVSTPAQSDRVRATSGVSRRVDGDIVKLSHTKAHGWNVTRGEAPALSQTSGRLATNAAGEVTDRCALDPKPDGPRYAACGDAVTVNVAHWIGLRLRNMAEEF